MKDGRPQAQRLPLARNLDCVLLSRQKIRRPINPIVMSDRNAYAGGAQL